MIVKEIIVVEGKSDTEAINKAVRADTIETNGSRVSRSTIEAIRHAKEKRGVIIFTDPDFPGERIRKIISKHVSGCKHAFITRSEGRGRENESLGIEHAAPEVIRAALAKVYTAADEPEERISMQLLRDCGLTGGPGARRRREKLGEALKIGYTNGKQLYKRLRMFQIKPEEFSRAMSIVTQGESDE